MFLHEIEFEGGWYVYEGTGRKVFLDDSVSVEPLIGNHIYISTDNGLPEKQRTELEDFGLIVHVDEHHHITRSEDSWVGIRDTKLWRTIDGVTWDLDDRFANVTLVAGLGKGFAVRSDDQWWVSVNDQVTVAPERPFACDGEYLAAHNKIYRVSTGELVRNLKRENGVELFQGRITWLWGDWIAQWVDGKVETKACIDNVEQFIVHPHFLEIWTRHTKWFTSDLLNWRQVSHEEDLLEDDKGQLWSSQDGNLIKVVS